MRSLLLYVLLMATLLPSISPWGTIAYYYSNRDYIARVLCENRNRPDLHCDGKCYLAKKLKAQQDKQDKETTERVHNTPSIQLFCENTQTYTFAPKPKPQPDEAHFAYQALLGRIASSDFFHPPTG